MPNTKSPSRKTTLSAGQKFITSLGKGPTFALKEVARALHIAVRGGQAEVLNALKSGTLVASVSWPDPSIAVELSTELWAEVGLEDFYIYERGPRGWHSSDFILKRWRLVRNLALPRLRAIRAHLEPMIGSAAVSPSTSEALADLDRVIRDLEIARASAEVFVTSANARAFALEYFGSIEHRGPGRPKTLPEMINSAQLEAFGRIYGATPRPKQDVLASDLAVWWQRHFHSKRSADWIRKDILRPIWKSLRLPEDS